MFLSVCVCVCLGHCVLVCERVCKNASRSFQALRNARTEVEWESPGERNVAHKQKQNKEAMERVVLNPS